MGMQRLRPCYTPASQDFFSLTEWVVLLKQGSRFVSEKPCG
jgi:hypothetical protein